MPNIDLRPVPMEQSSMKTKCSGFYDDGIADGNLTRCSVNSGCGLPGCLYVSPDAQAQGTWNGHKCDIYGPDPGTGQLPEGTTVGTSALFVAFSIGFGEEHLLQPEEADRLIALLQKASQKVKDISGKKA